MVFVKSLFMANVDKHAPMSMIGVKLNHVINFKIMVVVHTGINAISVTILKFVSNL